MNSERPQSNELRRNIWFVALLIGSMIVVFLLEFISPTDLLAYGLIPRTQRGLVGILTMPFLHGNFAHLTGNLMSLVVLLLFMMMFHPKNLIGVVVFVIFLGGILLWIFGRSASHVGASGLIYGLAAFMIVAGIMQRQFLEVVGSVAVAFLYGNSLFWGVLPFHPGVSWDGHLAGVVAGVILGLSSCPKRQWDHTLP